MKNFALGLTTGIVVGAGAAFFAEMLMLVAIEDSPNFRATFEKTYLDAVKK
jgi:hypothetical protein